MILNERELMKRRYDAHLNKQIEDKYSGGAIAFRLLIGGTDYTIDIFFIIIKNILLLLVYSFLIVVRFQENDSVPNLLQDQAA